jgi:hypothetical protein
MEVIVKEAGLEIPRDGAVAVVQASVGCMEDRDRRVLCSLEVIINLVR